jgi:asparagine N-glycosylation enzyme membrane subunit Stt3
MHHLKARLFAIVLIFVSLGLIYYNYSMKLAAFGPVITVGGLFLLISPTRAGKPTTTKEKITVLLVLVVGLLAGLVNWYFMDPGFFGR